MSGSIDEWATEPLYISGNPQSTDPVTFDTGNTGFTDSPSYGSSFGANATAIGKALKDLQAGLAPPPGSGGEGAGGSRGMPSGTSQSGTGQGSPAGMNALLNLLLQRANQYFPGQPNRQPVALPRPSGGGLLGI